MGSHGCVLPLLCSSPPLLPRCFSSSPLPTQCSIVKFHLLFPRSSHFLSHPLHCLCLTICLHSLCLFSFLLLLPTFFSQSLTPLYQSEIRGGIQEQLDDEQQAFPTTFRIQALTSARRPAQEPMSMTQEHPADV